MSDEPLPDDAGPNDLPSAADDAAPTPQPMQVVWFAVIFEGGLIFVAQALGWLCGVDPLRTLSWSWHSLAVGIVGTVPPVVVLLIINRYPVGPFADLKSVIDQYIVPIFQGVTVGQFAVIALLAGIGEELLFRGLLQGGLEDFLRGHMNPRAATWTALVAASIVFGLMHPITRLYALLCAIIGVYLGAIWVFVEPVNLLAPITIHALYDFIALLYLVRPTSRPT